MTSSAHGANLFSLSKKLNCSVEDFKDFSSNINPFAPSKKAIQKLRDNVEKISIYPDPQYKDLKSAIEKYCHCNYEDILLGCGASSFISGYIKILSPKNALIISPAYDEYKNELLNVNSNIFDYALKAESNFEIDTDDFVKNIKSNNIDTVIICNPNNPTGTVLSKDDVEKILQNTTANIVIDETYVEFTDMNKYSSVDLTQNYDRLFIIRSTSKFFACPGMRLGYSITSNKKIKEELIRSLNILWDINIFADIVGQEMFLDYDFHKLSFEKITNQRKYLFDSLNIIKNLKAYQSYGNFILVQILDESKNSKMLYDYMLQKMQIIRNCSSFETLSDKYFRVCILEDEDNRKLIYNIKNFFEN
ncbi:putative histidinol-phosphate transaminase [Peptostreptococcaceae bacterium AS15]|nr:putative histidinol-phosphate transaminase [Peptostreptococcaceae bacterium AS15]